MENREKIISITLQECKKIQNIINNDLLRKFAELHNVDQRYNFFHAKQELVADRAYFPGVKKKYSLNVVNVDGRNVDPPYREDKGLILRRSDYSSFTKGKISELIDMLLEENISFTKIKDFIYKTEVEFRSQIKKRNIDVARPVSWTKPIEEYKVLPMHLKGMMAWNTFEYEYFSEGTKGYLFYISGIDEYSAPDRIKALLMKNEVPNNIVIPFEEKECPSYYRINENAMLKFCWTERVDEIIDSIKAKIFRKKVDGDDLVLGW